MESPSPSPPLSPEDRAPRPRRAPWIVRALFALVAIGVMAAIVMATATAVSYYTVTHHIRRNEVAVPNLTGKSPAEALQLIAPIGLSLAFETSEYHDLIAENAILRQSPRPGGVAKIGTPVKVVLSRGPEYTATPSVVGFSLVDARVGLQASDLTVGEISRLHSDSVPIDNVIAQSPAPGEGLRREHPVNLLVSLGPAPLVHAAPDLVGMTLQEAERILDRIGCEVGRVTERDTTAARERGTVLEQSPPPGARLEAGQTVDLVVARRL